MTQDVIKKIEGIKIIPVVVLHDETKAAPLADALCRGGLPCAEVTFRTEAAKEGIRLMRKKPSLKCWWEQGRSSQSSRWRRPYRQEQNLSLVPA